MLVSCFQVLSFSQEIIDVRVEGLVHVNEQEVKEVIETKPGDSLDNPATSIRIQDDIRAMWGLGFFENITVSDEATAGGRNLIFEVLEKPKIADIQYTGNIKYKAKRLNEELKFTKFSRIFFDQEKANQLKNTLVDFYTSKSYPNTKITWETQETENEREVILVFTIEEGRRLPVKRIEFEGNTVIPDKVLKKRIQTKESFWFIFKKHYDEETAQNDLEMIRFAYANVGYLDAKAELGQIEELDNGLLIRFRIEEGAPYTIGSIAITGNSIFTEDEIRSRLSLRPGDLYSAQKAIEDRIAIRDLYWGQGFLDSDAPFRLDLDNKNHIVNIQIQISEAPRKFLGKVEIVGGVTLDDGTFIPAQKGEFITKNFVIEREIELKEGEPLDWTKVIESDRNLVNLNFFKTRGFPTPGQLNLLPGFERQPIPGTDIENLVLKLEEKETGLLTFGAGLSTAFGPSFFTTLSKDNLFGYGIRGSITGEIGELRNLLSLSLYEPHLLNSEYSAKWDIYYRDQEGYGGRRFEEERIGSSLVIGREITDELSILVGMKGEITDISPDIGGGYDLVEDTVPEVFQLGENTTTSISFGYQYDLRDFKLDPQNGIYTRSMVEVAGLTDNEFIKWENILNYYMPVYERLILALSGEFNLGYSYGDPGFLPIQERFFVGGSNSIRGFDEGSIGENRRIHYTDRNNNDRSFRTYLGGEASFVGNVELRYPITEIFQVVSFLDMGSVWPEIGDIDPTDFRFSTGAGLRVRIPGINALIRLDLGVPLRKFDEDETEFFHFSFGQSF